MTVMYNITLSSTKNGFIERNDINFTNDLLFCCYTTTQNITVVMLT